MNSVLPAAHTYTYLYILHFDHAGLIIEDKSTCGNGNILNGVLAVVPKAWSLDGSNLEANLEAVHYQSAECLTVHILSNDQQRFSVMARSLLILISLSLRLRQV